ncbi:MAG: DNA-directed RNA polymerase subunit beta [Gemmatimonadetes bacterium]|nr:DNA-directed RNA polymerase subunit beta [Gemmatimonadota bacterium]NNM04480.1 DNA-directed RNA polymerase subunit beta [Gemmatimonadota bacterium]
MPMPNLLDVQLRSFEKLVETEVPLDEQWDFGLDRVFGEIFPISDVNENFTLEYVSSTLGEPKYSVEECIERDMTFAAPLKATLRLIVWEDLEDGERRPGDIIEKEVYLGDLPLLTELGTFIINGAERVVVSQLHRSPGVIFEENIHPNGTKLHSARIIPFRGSWVEFTIDINNICYVHIDKKKKFPATALLRAFGYGTDADVYQLFFDVLDVNLSKRAKAGQRDVSGAVLAADLVDPETGEILLESGSEIDEEAEGILERSGVKKIQIYGREGGPGGRGDSPIVKNTLKKDPTADEGEALSAIYSLLRPGEPPNIDTARTALERVFFNPKRYDLGRVGRYKINQRLNLDVPRSTSVLTRDDFVAILRYLIELSGGVGYTDDIDHLGNRRVRTVGELIANQFSVGLSRMARLVKERMSINTDPEKINIDDLVNARTVSAVIQAFFGSSQLSQFMDQTNPLAEMTHKRRLSALGPGGLTRERAGFEVRDVHYSHYGRMCPIETPEGPNIGLITSLTTYSRINELGFVETPYRKVVKGKVTDNLEWLSANEEEEVRIAQANAPLNDNGTFRNEFVLCREKGDFPLLRPEDIDYMDVAPDQLVSVAAALIPFLEHDDANRALMGSNMQRQAVPLLHTDAPLVGTGLEAKVARDSGAVITARRGGEVVHVTADEIVVDTGSVTPGKAEQPLAKLAQFDRYRLKKFWRTNQDTAINQRPLVRRNQSVKPGEIIADGPSTDHGELALGRNVLCAFMPWYGYNFEDAIVISEKLVREDVYTSIHIQELELHVRDTKRGMEEITREIPNVAEESLVDLDERGIVRIGARVKSGDILVGKITPKGETELSPEEKLLTAIFGEKAKDVKDSALRLPPGMAGTVIDVKIFSRRIDDPLLEKEHGAKIGGLRSEEREEIGRITEARDEELKDLMQRQTIALCLKKGTVEPYLKEGTKVTKDTLADINFNQLDLTTLKVQNKAAGEKIRRVIDEAQRRIDRVREKTEEQIDKVFQPDELPPGVVQLVKVYIAEKRKIAVGDKMAGRHGNKGIIARIAPEEDMPFLPDGTPVEIVLNPLGVPSRMNVGQILETHLGWAAKILGFEAKTPVFQGASEDEVGTLLKIAGASWARNSLLNLNSPPALVSGEIQDFLDAVDSVDGAKGRGTAKSKTAGNGEDPEKRGIGRPLDAYCTKALDKKKKAKAAFQKLKEHVVETGRMVAESRGQKLNDAFPAVASLARKKVLNEGLDDAVVEIMSAAELLASGKVWLRDGRSGRRFDFPVTVGAIYMLKLSHLVDDKIHARSIGPYSLVTQQPLAGKAQFGGQRFGEMEVWALEAYGAAHTLQEILTVKSDDVTGRSKVYEAIVKGENLPQPGIPESFNVLVKELQALGLSVTLGSEE